MSYDVAKTRSAFPILSTEIDGQPLRYLDNAATSQIPLGVIQAMTRHETTARANIHRGNHRLATLATDAYEGGRAAVARYLNAVSPDDVVMTYGATSALNLAAFSFGETLGPDDEVLVSELEHHSNLVPWQMLRDRRGLTLRAIPTTPDGRLALDTLEQLLTPRCKLIAVTHCSNVTGAVTDVARIVEMARTVGARVLLDGAQRAPHGPVDVQSLGADFYALSGHKMYGPNASGALWGRREVLDPMPPFMTGGHMIDRVSMSETSFAVPPQRFEAGTPMIAQAVGLGAAADWLMTLDWDAVHAHTRKLADRLLRGLTGIPGATVVGPRDTEMRVPLVSFTLEGWTPDRICQEMSRRGIALRGGHHCAQPAMAALKVPGTARASIALYNTVEEVDILLEAVEDLTRQTGRHACPGGGSQFGSRR